MDENKISNYLKILSKQWKYINTRESITRVIFDIYTKENNISSEWVLDFDSAKTRCACCRYSIKKVVVSRNYLNNKTVDLNKMKNTLLHEIAHIMTPGDGHGQLWKRVALQIGCDGKRCSDIQEIMESKWLLKCKCGMVNLPRHRRCLKKVKNWKCKECLSGVWYEAR